MQEEIFNLVAFTSTHSAIKAEKELIIEGISVKIIPVPREITAGCGLSIRFNLEDLDKVRKKLADNGIETYGYYRVKKTGLTKEIRSIF
jgi:hypothetical protein